MSLLLDNNEPIIKQINYGDIIEYRNTKRCSKNDNR